MRIRTVTVGLHLEPARIDRQLEEASRFLGSPYLIDCRVIPVR